MLFLKILRKMLLLVLPLLLVYLGVSVYLYVNQTKFIFSPNMEFSNTPKQFGCMYDELRFGPNRLHGWWLPSSGSKTLLYLHGSQSNVSDRAEHACGFQRAGLNVLIFDYRGYGKSDGPFPSEQSVYEDSQSAWDYLQKKGVPADDIIIYGHSLGTGVAIEIASRHPDAAALISESGFTSLYDIAMQDPVFSLFPVSLILNQEFDSIAKVSELFMPKLFIHGADDTDAPAQMTQLLYDASRQPKALLIVDGAKHDDIYKVDPQRYWEAIRAFLDSLRW